MRTLTLALVAGLSLTGFSTAQAADLDYGVLRGPDYEPELRAIDWNGVYVGGFAGYSSASLSFKNVFQPLVAKELKDTTAEAEFNASTLLAPVSTRVDGASYGAFVGYNYQFDDTVIGIEADYTRFDVMGSTSDAIARYKTTTGGYLETVALTGTSSTTVQDYGTIRARAGYAFGSLLPFITGGLAIGRAVVTDQVGVQNYGYDQTTYQSNLQLTTGSPAYVNRYGYAAFDQRNPGAGTPAAPTVIRQSKIKTVGGVTLGAGVEFALTQNIILRGEYQYVLFNDFDGHKVNMNTVRAGAALKF